MQPVWGKDLWSPLYLPQLTSPNSIISRGPRPEGTQSTYSYQKVSYVQKNRGIFFLFVQQEKYQVKQIVNRNFHMLGLGYVSLVK